MPAGAAAMATAAGANDEFYAAPATYATTLADADDAGTTHVGRRWKAHVLLRLGPAFLFVSSTTSVPTVFSSYCI